jgi:hypothetical protein
MGEALKILGQSAPAATTLTAIYTVPVSTQTTCSTIVVCNRNAVAIKFRVSVAIGGAADAVAQYLYYDVALAKNDTFAATFGITLATTDVVRVQSDTANVSFNLFGAEIT